MKRSIPSPDWGTPRAVIANGFIFLSGTTSKHRMATIWRLMIL